ncbi:MAG: radical SAM protein [Clostridiales bacterium]|nr:radical SAM protein [Clostridiales bacterium]
MIQGYDSQIDFIVPDFPLHLDIEVTSRCNLNCEFCDKQPLLKKGQLGDIEFSLFNRIIDEAGEAGLESLGLSYRGEPLLHRDIADMVYYAKSKGVKFVFFCTNAMLLTPIISEKLIDAGLDRIIISAQGTTAHTFEYSRLGAKFNVVLRNLDMLRNLISKKGASLEVWAQAVALKELNEEEFKQFWMQRCDNAVVVRYRESEKRIEGLKSSWVCPQPWSRLTVEWDGTILPCSNNDVRSYSLGNASIISIAEAWNSEAINKIRKYHMEGRSHEIKDCDGCPFRTVAIQNYMERKG